MQLRIRKEQMDALDRHMASVFVDQTVVHVRRYFPAQFSALSEAGTRELIAYGIERAAAHGFVAQSDVGKYIDIMIVYGRDFDRSPALPWARATLGDPSLSNPEIRINALCDEAVAWQSTGGPSDGSATPAEQG
jgi:hypothetical protein